VDVSGEVVGAGDIEVRAEQKSSRIQKQRWQPEGRSWKMSSSGSSTR
jgi:hypothetical protein